MNIPDYLHGTVAEIVGMEHTAAMRRSLWATILNLQPTQDGNQFCVLWGKNLQEGIAAFGDTPEAAMFAFETEMCRKATTH